MTKRLPRSKRLAFSRLICAMQTLDISQLLLSFDEMGLRLKREDPLEDLSEFRFAFRETESAVESRATTLAHIQKAKEKYESLPRNERNPVEAFPSELMLFFRTVFLLRGLCTSLNVRVKYLKTMSAWAKRAMIEEYHSIPASIKDTNPLDSKIITKLGQINFVGLQLHVLNYKSNQCLANLSLGQLHPLDARPVKTSTLFPVLSLAQGVSQIISRSMISSTQLRVKDIWKSFMDESLTVEKLLSGDLPMLPISATRLPERFSLATIHKWKEYIEFIEISEKIPAEEKVSLPWELSILSFTWGWMVVGLLQSLSEDKSEACKYETFVIDLSRMMGIDLFVKSPSSEFPLAPPKKGCSKQEEESLNKKRETQRKEVQSRYVSLSVDVDKLLGGAVDLDKLWDIQSAREIPSGENPAGFDVGAILRALGPSFKGKEYFIDPRMMNHPHVKASCSPSCNLLTNATSLAKLYAAVANNGIWDSKQVIPIDVSDFYVNSFLSETLIPALEPLGERLGIKIFEFKTADDKILRGFGQVAFGGSIVFTIPALGLSLCVLVSDLTLEREVSRIIVETVLEEFGLRLNTEI